MVSVQSNPVQYTNAYPTPQYTNQGATNTNHTPAPAMAQDNTQLSAGLFKRMGNAVGEMFSDLAYSMKTGETYRLVEREFLQVDVDQDGALNLFEFTAATVNPFDFQSADKNYDGAITRHEYANYRKDRLERAFDQKDASGDRHLNVAEIGSVGRIYLEQRDPRVDLNQDGLMNKREFVKAHLTLGVSIRDLLGF